MLKKSCYILPYLNFLEMLMMIFFTMVRILNLTQNPKSAMYVFQINISLIEYQDLIVDILYKILRYLFTPLKFALCSFYTTSIPFCTKIQKM